MSIQIAGFKYRVVKEVQSRLDEFFECTKVYETAKKALDEMVSKNVELANKPAHEDRYQILLSEYKEAAKSLKAAAIRIENRTDHKHIKKYFGPEHYILHEFKDYLKEVHEEAARIIKIDFETPINEAQNASKSRKTEALASIEFNQIDQTFPSCRDRLIKESPDEYLRQASLYQIKLLEKKDEAAFLEFGNSWIKNLPKEATWQQVENMSLLMIEAATTSENVDLSEYRTAVQQWLKEHPLPENSNSVDIIPGQARSPSGQRTYVLGLLYLHDNQKLDLSAEAYKVYQRCSAIYPDEHSWKLAQAFYHISKLQWIEAEQLLADLSKDDAVTDTLRYLKVTQARYCIDNLQWKEAEQLLADLPQDNASVRDAQRDLKVTHAGYCIDHLQWIEAEQLLADLPKDDASVRETRIDLEYYLGERIYSAAMDVSVMALSKFMPSSYREGAPVDIGLTVLHLGTSGTVRRMWVPCLLGMPERAISPNPYHLSWGLSLPLAGDVVDCAFRNIAFLEPLQTYESFASCSLRMAHTAVTLYTNPLQRSLPAFVNLGSLVLSSGQSLDACRGIHRSAGTQASLSSLQLMASDITFGVAVASYSDLFPVMASSLGANSLADRISFDSSSEGEGNFRDTWVLGAIVIGSVAFRSYRDYPYLWAAAVMRDIEFYSSQGDQAGVQKVLADAENKYFVSSVRHAVKDYALYADKLKEFPRCLDDPDRCKEFLMHLDLILNTLKVSHHYRGIRNNLLLKKMEAAIIKQDAERFKDVFKERPNDKIVVKGFNFLMSSCFHNALRDPDAACSFLREIGHLFPSRFHSTSDSLVQLFQTEAESLKEWQDLSVFTAQKNPPTEAQIKRWNNSLPKLQGFLSKNVGEKEVYQALQYYKLMIAFAQTDNADVTQAYFAKSNPELHHRFFHDLVDCTRQLRKRGKHQEAICLVKRAQINSFIYNELIQNYGDFFSLLFSLPLQKNANLKEIQKLESYIAGLNTKDGCHQALCAFFESCRIVLSFDAGEYENAQRLLAQETTDLRVSDEVAALLFERVEASLKANGAKKSLIYLQGIIKHLGSWQHLELFKAYQAYLVCEHSFEAQLECRTALINRMTNIEQLSDFTSNLQYLQEFELRLSQAEFEEAKRLLTAPVPTEFYSQLCNILLMYFIHRREKQRETGILRELTKTLQSLNDFLAPNSAMIQNYVNFLDLLDNIEGKRKIAVHDEARQSLRAIFEGLISVQRPIPRSLEGEWVDINLEIARLAGEAGQRKIGLEALAAIKLVVIPDEKLEQYISNLERQLNA